MNNPQREQTQQPVQHDAPDPRERDQRVYNEQPRQPVNQEHPHDGEIWSAMGEYRHRFEQLQMEFIERPKETVASAEALANEAVERMTSTLHDRLNHIHSELGDGTSDTERMRVAMSHYRQLMDSLSGRRAA